MKTFTKTLSIFFAGLLMFSAESSFSQTIATITYSVDMKFQIATGGFNPATDWVDVAGPYRMGNNDWNTYSTKASDPRVLTASAGSTVYTGTFSDTIPSTDISGIVQYKYRINGSWTNSDQHLNGNRMLVVSVSGAYNTPSDVYLDQSGTVVAATITFNCNMSHQISAGNFNPATDKLYVTGFNKGVFSTDSTDVKDVAHLLGTTGIYTVTVSNVLFVVPDSGSIDMKFKYLINGSWTNSDSTGIYNDKDNNRILVIKTGTTTYTTHDFYKDLGMGIADINNSLSVFLKQNPVADQLTVLNQDIFNYGVYNFSGQIIQSGNTGNGSLNVSELPGGIYFLRIIDQKNKIGSVKFIKD